MPTQIVDTQDGIFTASISGTMSRSDMDELQRAAATWLGANDEGSLLILADKFNGWGGGDWTDMSFQLQFDRKIRKMAIVCDPQWADQIMLFVGQGLRKVPIEQFLPSDQSKARTWLKTGA